MLLALAAKSSRVWTTTGGRRGRLEGMVLTESEKEFRRDPQSIMDRLVCKVSGLY